LKNVVEVGGYPKSGGIEEFGNFSEGFCFKLNVATTLETYVICSDDQVSTIFKLQIINNYLFYFRIFLPRLIYFYQMNFLFFLKEFLKIK
jgi:hypothetical protein